MKYTYNSITTQPDLDEIHVEVANSAMTDNTIEWCAWDEDAQTLDIKFTGTLSGGDKTILDGIVSAVSDQDLTSSDAYNSIELSFGVNGYGLEGGSTSYTLESRMIWEGSKRLGEPTGIRVIAEAGGTSGWVKLYDVTNAKTIAEKEFTNNSPELISLDNLSDISKDEAIWEIQIKKVGGGFSIVHALSIRF